MNSPKISIIMPMYGVEKYIANAINSVLNQTFQDWELLVVNDGSLDNSREIAYSYATRDSRINILDKKNGGLSDARNYGLERARGEYVHFFDSDDWIEPDFYSKMLSVDDSYDLIVGGYKVDNEKSTIARPCYSGELHNIVGHNLYNFVGTYLNFAWNKLFRRSFLVNHSLQYEKNLYRIEDSEFMSRFLAYNPNVVLTTCPCYHYMVRNTATLSNIFDENIYQHLNRSITIHASIYRQLCNDEDIICRELTLLSKMAVKSVLNKMLEDVPYFSIKRAKQMIQKLLRELTICKYLKYLPNLNFPDRVLIFAIKNKYWGILLFIFQLSKFKNSIIK